MESQESLDLWGDSQDADGEFLAECDTVCQKYDAPPDSSSVTPSNSLKRTQSDAHLDLSGDSAQHLRPPGSSFRSARPGGALDSERKKQRQRNLESPALNAAGAEMQPGPDPCWRRGRCPLPCEPGAVLAPSSVLLSLQRSAVQSAPGSPGAEDHAPPRCSRCGLNKGEMVTCVGCDATVHPGCYNTTVNPSDEWHCNLCMSNGGA